ncbi:hypothetical protein V6N11_067633 [Hibiscus sabdariffa]|uniref:Secreted protein n=1 Tax=Hibiscus sabdariffa TaxID=183260 RepID=A0ABR2SRD7_9ROSI
MPCAAFDFGCYGTLVPEADMGLLVWLSFAVVGAATAVDAPLSRAMPCAAIDFGCYGTLVPKVDVGLLVWASDGGPRWKL